MKRPSLVFFVLLILAVLSSIAVLLRYPAMYIVSFAACCYVFAFLLARWMVVRILPERLTRRSIVFNIGLLAGLVALFVVFFAVRSLFGMLSDDGDAIPDKSALDNLRSLPYVNWVPADDTMGKSGVTQYEADLAYGGMSIYAARSAPLAHLIDMSGGELHRWKLDPTAPGPKIAPVWPLVELCENGDLLALSVDHMMTRIDWNSETRWTTRFRAHHDFCVADNGDVYALGREDDIVLLKGVPVPILADYIAVLSPEGSIKRRIPLYHILKDAVPWKTIAVIYKSILNPKRVAFVLWRTIKGQYSFDNGSAFDVFHFNASQLITKDIDGICEIGDLLISARNLDWVGILDSRGVVVRWEWGPGEISGQHHPTQLENGNILIFDNGLHGSHSRIIELNPRDNKIEWEYRAEPAEEFYSRIRGSCQRLPNGNTLVTDSEKGRAFEVTLGGGIVWEFYSPYTSRDGQQRAPIYRLTRITDPQNYPRLSELQW